MSRGVTSDMRIFVVFLLVLLAASAAAFSALHLMHGMEYQTATLMITDDFNRTVVINGTPSKIVSMAPSCTEILFAIGAGDRVVGVTEYCNYPESVQNITKVGGVSTISLEKIVALNPDVVFGCELNGRKVFERLTSLGIPVVGFNPKNLSGIMNDIIVAGEVTGERRNATRLVEMMQLRIQKIVQKTNNTYKPKVALITWHDPIWVTGSGTVQDELITLAGGENAFGYLEGWKSVSLEEFIDRDPDVIIVSVGHGVEGEKPYEYILNEERMKIVSAVKNGHVYKIDADVVSRPGPRIVYALEEIAKMVHPEIFS